MKKVKISALCAALALGVAVTGCGTSSTGSSSNSGGSTANAGSNATANANGKKYTIATVVKLGGTAWFGRMEEGIKQFAKDTGANCYMISPPQADAAQQVKLIQNLIAQKVDAIIVDPDDPQTLEPVLQRARQAGIVVIATEGAGMKNVDYDVEAFDNSDYGKHFMDQLGKDMGGKGKYAEMVGSLQAVSHNQWVDAAIAQQKTEFPNMQFTGDKLITQENQETAYQVTKQLLKAHPDVTGIQGSSAVDIVGAAQAVSEMGLTGKIHLVGTSLVSIAGRYLKDGTLDSISFWDPAEVGYVTDEVAMDLLQHKSITSGMDLGQKGYDNVTVQGNLIVGKAWIDVTKDNMDQYNF